MALFNRILIILLSIVVLVGAGAVLLTTVGLIHPEQAAASGALLAERLVQFTQLDSTTWRWTVLICLGIMLLALLLLVVELLPGKRAPRTITLKDDKVGKVTVSLEGLRKLADREAGHVPGVVRARSDVAEVPPGLQISCKVFVDPSRSVPNMSEKLQERVKSSVEHHVGITVTQVQVETQVAPVATNRRPRRVE
jgi:uncharacterized alkaline shock family protein YloU